MSSKKQGGKTRQHKRPVGKRLGVKVNDGQRVIPGMIVLRQRGTRVSAGKGVKVGRDHSLYATQEGIVKFGQKLGKRVASII